MDDIWNLLSLDRDLEEVQGPQEDKRTYTSVLDRGNSSFRKVSKLLSHRKCQSSHKGNNGSIMAILVIDS